MKVLLIQSFAGSGVIPVFPLALSYIAKAIDNQEIRCFDPNVEDNYLEKLRGLLKGEFRPDVVGISIRNIWPFQNEQGQGIYYKEAVVPLLRLIKSCGEQVICIGGPGFSAYAHEIMQDLPEVDYGVFREAEQTFPQLLENLGQPQKVKGVFYRKEGKVYFTGPRQWSNFNDLPNPQRDIFDLSRYKNIPGSMGVQSKRGCALRCAYCVYPYLCGEHISLRSPKNVVDEIEYLAKTYDIREIVFVDTVFNVPAVHAQDICSELIRRRLDIKWTAWFHLKSMSKEFMKLAIESGCYLFEFSSDAYTDRMLELLHKDITQSDIKRTYKLIKKIDNANVGYNFFVNGPGENIFTFLKLLLFYVRAKIFLGPKLKKFFFSHLHIEPNTELERLARKRGQIVAGAKFLGSQEIYDKMIYRNSIVVDKLFKILSRTKKTVESVGS